MKKSFLLLVSALMAFILASCTSPLLPGEVPDINAEGTVQFSWSQPGQANNSRSSFSRNVVATGNNIQDAKKVVITVEAADGTVVYSQKQLTLFNFNGSFLSEPLSLKVGSYKLTEYLLLDAAGTVIYATPKEGSAKAHLVADPLPINFTVTKDAATNVKPEVVDAADVTPADFGYATFSFNEVKVFNFLVSVMVYDAGAGNFALTDATMNVTNGVKAYNFNLAPATNNIAVNDLTGNYTLTFSKTGYEEHRVSYTNAELKAFFQNPLVVVLTKSQAPADKVITFADPGLEAAVRAAIKKPSGDIYKSDVATLTNLNSNSRKIANLSGIEELTSLTSLSLGSNSITDITPIGSLKELTYLNLFGNKIVDIAQLSNLTKLTALYLSSNLITDMTALASLANLRTLDIYTNNIVDISALKGLTKLQSLHLAGNKIVDITPLSNLTALFSLNLSDNQVSDITPLSTLTNMINLSLDNNPITNISPLSPLKSVQTLILTNNRITDWATLSALVNLKKLYLDNTGITAITVMGSLTNLTELNLNKNSITDISPLSTLTNLKYIYLFGNQITDLTPLLNNSGLGSNDRIDLRTNPLSTDAQNVQIPALQARGVNVSF